MTLISTGTTAHNNNNNNNNNNRLLNKLINNKIINKSSIIISFSIKPQDYHFIEDLDRIAKAEAGSRNRSQTILRAIKEFVPRHIQGNPQLLMENYVKSDKPKPVRVLCSWLDGALTSGEVHCRKRQMWLSSVECYSCKHNRLKKQKNV